MNGVYTIAGLLAEYTQGLRPRDVVARLRAALRADDPAWILRCDDAFVDAQLARLERHAPAELPLYGVPFAVKDNIDVQGLPTTAACPAYAYTAGVNASCVQRLLDAGAVLLGKTNLDQFATGLVGTRSPYGAVPNSFDPRYVSGGSSSGSASVVARGLVAFALGTDTAGSGRVPAGFNNIVGCKPTPGLVGARGVVPACATLDTVSVFALTAADAARVLALIEGGDEANVVAPAPPGPAAFPPALRVGVPQSPDLDGSLGYVAAFAQQLERITQLGAAIVPLDTAVLHDIAALLYDGPWVAERYVVVRDLLERQPDALDPIVRRVIAHARGIDAAKAFEGRYRLGALARQANALWERVDVLMLPTAPTLPTLAAVAEEPLLRNSELGRFTNFVNLLGWSALALPAAITPRGQPFGVTFVAPGGHDAALLRLGAQWQALLDLPLGAHLAPALPHELQPAAMPRCEPTVPIAVVGAHLEGQPLHGQLVERRARCVARTRTAPSYRLHALPDTTPPKPGLARVADREGHAIEVEVYEMPAQHVGSFLALIPPPLGLGSIELEDGRWVKGFICEPHALRGARDISAFGGWRGYLRSIA
ncbi:MAG: allophanate hydrolase [Burkholderiaceae bacterium]|nr:allophanate hydrolase [Burkholderiaceae bacterium]